MLAMLDIVMPLDGSRPEGMRARRSLLIILTCLLVGLAAIPIFALQPREIGSAGSVLAVGIAIAGASVFVGGLVGLLFGIPRRLQQSDEQKAEPGAAATGRTPAVYAANTNLEQISDWLTKILVGVGLIHLPQLGGALTLAGAFAKPGFGGTAASPVFAVAIIIYFFVGGFLIGYLATRLYLGQALAAAEQAYSREKELTEREKQSRADADAINLATAQLEGSDLELPKQAELERVIRAASRTTRSLIFYRAQRQRRAKTRIERTLVVFGSLIASDTDAAYDANHAELGFALKDQRTPDWKAAEASLSQAIAIRGNKPDAPHPEYEANRAYCRIMQDENFAASQPATDDTKNAIVADLKYAAAHAPMKEWIETSSPFKAWLRLNGLDLNNLP